MPRTSKVYSADEALEWFLNHSSGSILCIKGMKEKEVDSYPEAEEFFINESEKEAL